MKRGPSGRYEISNVSGEQVRAFIPHDLPPEPPLDLADTHQRLLERATLALGRLDSLSLLLPDPNFFLYAYVRREAVLSSQIEGTQSSLSDLLLFELEEVPGMPFDDVVEISNYVAALEHGMARLRQGDWEAWLEFSCMAWRARRPAPFTLPNALWRFSKKTLVVFKNKGDPLQLRCRFIPHCASDPLLPSTKCVGAPASRFQPQAKVWQRSSNLALHVS